jgi:hypothetical protein
MLHLEHSIYGAETWTLRQIDHKYLESFEMWCWRRMEEINWTDCVENEEVLQNVQGRMEHPSAIKGRKEG